MDSKSNATRAKLCQQGLDRDSMDAAGRQDWDCIKLYVGKYKIVLSVSTKRCNKNPGQGRAIF